ncbi:soluble lamin-associated protein of 75 kDa-like [Sardina pilchardus]|uniref:soluble lamin-associated protein of 75 kDa-like n=1 Tax=Sardina pilchardus TaxID=27697 RepID=UPI002E13651F
MAFPVDILTTVDYESLEQSSKDYMSKLLYRSTEPPEYLNLPNSKKVEIGLCNVSFVPLHGTDVKHKILALFTLEDPFTAVGLYLQGQWWPVEDVLKTSDASREGILEVGSVGERVALYVLNRIVYRATEMSKDEVPFLCHGENDFAKIIWKNGEAIGFYSVKPEGSLCSSFLTQRYQLPVLDSMFVRKCHRGNGHGLQILEDFVDSFKNDCLGLKYPLSAAMYKVCGKYLSTYPADTGLLWEVESVGGPFQRTQIASKIQEMGLKGRRSLGLDASMEDVLTKVHETVEYTVEVVEKVVQVDTHIHITKEVEETPVVSRSKSSQLRRKRLREESTEVVDESLAEKVIRVEKIEAGNETPVEETADEEQKEDEGEEDMEAGDVEAEDVVSTVVEKKLDLDESDVNETQASDVTATVIDKDGHENTDTPMETTEQLSFSPEQVSTIDTVEPALEIPASEEATTTGSNDPEEEYSSRKSPVEEVQREDEGEESSQKRDKTEAKDATIQQRH